MRIEFENTIDEYIELQLYLLKSNIILKGISLLVKYLYIFFCICKAIEYYFKYDGLLRYILLMFFIFIIWIWIIIFSKFGIWGARKGINIIVRKYPNMLSKKTVTILEDEIVIDTIEKINKFKINVKDIYKVINIKESLYIFEGKYMIDVIIPLSSFKEERDKEKFLMLLQPFMK